MAHKIINKNQNKTINTLIVSALRSQQAQELENSINYAYGLLGNIFQILDTEENVPVTQIIPCLAMLLKKNGSVIANIVKKTHSFIRKTKNYVKKNPNDIETLHPDFSEEGKEERPAEHVGVFCQNLGITVYTLENYSKIIRKLFENYSKLF